MTVADLFEKSIDPKSPPEETVDVGGLITHDIHSAAAMLNDLESNKERKLARMINLLILKTGRGLGLF